MNKNYKIVITYNRVYCGHTMSQDLYLSTNNAGLGALLHVLEDNNTVDSIQVYNTIAVPSLHTLSKLTKMDLGIDAEGISKLK